MRGVGFRFASPDELGMSLRARLLLAFAYVLVLVIVALEVPLALNLSKRVDAEIKSEAQGQTQLLAAGASGTARRRGAAARARRELRAGPRRARDRGRRGRRAARRLGEPGARGGGADYASRPEIARALDGEASQGERHSNELGEDLLFTAAPIIENGRPEGAVRVTQGVDAVDREVRNDIIALIGVGIVALLLGLAVAWLLAGSLAKPLRGLAASARRVARGDLDARAEVEGSTEQQEVATAFNDMTGRLGRSLRSQREFVANASHQLRTPLTGLRLRLEAAAAKSDDPEVRDELAAAEHETERLARLLAELLTLAGERERPEPQPVDVGDAAGGSLRALAPPGAPERARADRRRGPADGGVRLPRGRRGDARQPDRERAALLARGRARDDRLAQRRPARPHRRRGRGAGHRCGRGASGSSSASTAAPPAAARTAPGSVSTWSRRSRSAGTARPRSTNRPEGGARAEIVLPAHSSLPAADQGLTEAGLGSER